MKAFTKVITAATTIALGAGIVVSNLGGTYKYESIEWKKPTNDQGWAEDTKKESLNIRTDHELQKMLSLHKAQLEQFESFDAVYVEYPDALRPLLMKEGYTGDELEAEILKRVGELKWQRDKLHQSIERMEKEIELRKSGAVDRTEDIKQVKK